VLYKNIKIDCLKTASQKIKVGHGNTLFGNTLEYGPSLMNNYTRTNE